ncbi:MAG: neutral/alkaline non-lysosomal ceramidase N-terminal domain-containing protein [Balneolaceae bacterium]|nr:neutral/alkaline non-lysosomal ceramidase N-terminal domain-containing protein [Balneolaceae bacterium]
MDNITDYRSLLTSSADCHAFGGGARKTLTTLIFSVLLLLPPLEGHAADKPNSGTYASATIEVGVSRVDITPVEPIRLAGYGSRDSVSAGVLQKLWAKAMAFGSDAEGPSVLITVDLIGIPDHITSELTERITEKTAVTASRLVISSSHTHTGPEVGTLLNHFGEPLPAEQLGRIVEYLDRLADKLEQVALEALKDRRPAQLAWGKGEAGFAVNRRVLKNGKWVGFGVVPEGPVDHSMPMMRVADPDGELQAVLLSYACHGTTLGGEVNMIHGDWMGEAQRIIEQRHPGVTAMVAIGAAGDANPEPRTRIEYTTRHGEEIADEVDRLLSTRLNPLTSPPTGRKKIIDLAYSHVPTTDELVEQASARGSEGYYARVALDRLARGREIPAALSYPVQTWTFGDDLAMIFLAGEVVVDYSLRLKRELGAERLWVTAYSNAVPSYIPSRRILREGGYEAEYSMYSYDHPSPFAESIEDRIMDAVYGLLPPPFTGTE